jgi:methionyl-tRNA formyltransferase
MARAEADRRLAALGGQLLVEVIRSLEGGTLSVRPQPAGGSYQPMPTVDDFKIDTSWSARRAFNFMRGTVEWGQPYPIEIGAERLPLASAIAYAVDEVLETTHIQSGDEVRIQFAPGVLIAKTYRSAHQREQTGEIRGTQEAA